MIILQKNALNELGTILSSVFCVQQYFIKIL